jgi:hypothetical protein
MTMELGPLRNSRWLWLPLEHLFENRSFRDHADRFGQASEELVIFAALRRHTLSKAPQMVNSVLALENNVFTSDPTIPSSNTMPPINDAPCATGLLPK